MMDEIAIAKIIINLKIQIIPNIYITAKKYNLNYNIFKNRYKGKHASANQN